MLFADPMEAAIIGAAAGVGADARGEGQDHILRICRTRATSNGFSLMVKAP